MKKFLFSGIEPTCKWADLGLTATRVIVGLTLALVHGFKKFPMTDGFIGYVASAGIESVEKLSLYNRYLFLTKIFNIAYFFYKLFDIYRHKCYHAV
ncbi:MAG: hypothetical protein LDLANPLL_02865 [Turneriella sp.]|nr:hypothetical protein [Turneriella sp.]